MHALEVEPGAAAIAAQRFGGGVLHAGVVEVVEVAARHLRGFERALLAIDQAVVLVEAPFADQRVHLAAAAAAELRGVVGAWRGGPHERRRHRLPAVGAGDSGAACGRSGRGGNGRHRAPPSMAMASSAATVTRAACTKRMASCVVSRRSSQVPGSSRRTSVR